MHEMSVAINILEIAEKEMQKAKAKRIEEIHLAVGKLSGIVIESLQFSLDVLKKNSILANAEITFEEIDAKMRCLHCQHEFEASDFYVTCPECGEFGHSILSGKELLIKSIAVT